MPFGPSILRQNKLGSCFLALNMEYLPFLTHFRVYVSAFLSDIHVWPLPTISTEYLNSPFLFFPPDPCTASALYNPLLAAHLSVPKKCKSTFYSPLLPWVVLMVVCSGWTLFGPFCSRRKKFFPPFWALSDLDRDNFTHRLAKVPPKKGHLEHFLALLF